MEKTKKTPSSARTGPKLAIQSVFKTPSKTPVKKSSPAKSPRSVSRNPKDAPLSEFESSAEHSTKGTEKSRIIKKYPNRRLYDTLHSTYVTLFDIKGLAMASTPFVIIDAKTGEDLTRSILMQIILEEESAGRPLFSTQSLLKMIRFYGNSLQGLMSPFLEQNLNQFVELQNQYVAHCQKIGGIASPETWVSFVNKQNNVGISHPMHFLFETGSKILEQMQSQSLGVMNGFPFQNPK